MTTKPVEFRIPDWDAVVDEVATELHKRIQRRTPVATGKARDGWELTGKPGERAIRNEVPYIGVLEYGSSDKAPNGMVRVSLEESGKLIEDAVNKQMK